MGLTLDRNIEYQVPSSASLCGSKLPTLWICRRLFLCARLRRSCSRLGVLASPPKVSLGQGCLASASCRFPAAGCDVAEDPDKDGRNAQPQWLSSSDLLHVRPEHTRNSTAHRFDAGRILGRKRLRLDGLDLALTADLSAQGKRSPPSGVQHARAAAASLTPHLRSQLDSFSAQAQALEARWQRLLPRRRCTTKVRSMNGLVIEAQASVKDACLLTR